MTEPVPTHTLDDFKGTLNWPALQAWIEAAGLPGRGACTAVHKLAGGVQNAVFLIERGEARFVLRRPSRHVRPGGNETMLREARILAALAGTDVPLPRVLARCDDENVIGTCFYVMEPLEGFAPSKALPGAYGSDIAWRSAMGDEMVRAAAALGAVDPAAVGLGDLGKPDQWHERQVSRWQSQFEGYFRTPGYEAALPDIDAIGRWLTDHLPGDRRIGIVHGDFQFPNVMFSLQAPRVSGVVDWELASQGNPLLDLGWILTSWWEDGDPDGKSPLVTPWSGFRSRAELVRLYGEISGRDMRDMPWFFALACYKLACLLEGTYARSLSGQIPEAVGKSVRDYAIWLTKKAMQIIA